MSTILEVAAKAGVSHATVTRYFRQPALLAPETYQRVKQAVEELHYVPNAAARALYTGKTNLISLIVPDITSSFYTKMVTGAEDAVHKNSYTLTLGKSGRSQERERAYLDAFLSYRVDGVVLVPGLDSLEHVEMLLRHKMPLVLVDRVLEGVSVDVVCGDSFQAGKLLATHLLEQGIKDIAFVGGQKNIWSLEQRLAGYKAVMQEARLPERIYLDAYSATSGELIVHSLIAEDKLPEAILAASSRVVLGVFKALRESDIRVPDDITVVCVDDVESASMITPFLTVVEQPAYEIGELSMQLLLDRINGNKKPPVTHVLPVELIVRQSSLKK